MHNTNKRNVHWYKTLAAGAIGLFCTVAAQAVEVDLLLIYDNETNSHYRGSPNTALRAMVDQTNTYYERSGVDVQLNIVGIEQLEIEDSLGVLRSNSTVNRLRNDLGADFVSYITGSYSGACGVGYLTTNANSAYNMVARRCMARSFAHEMGHNMGLGHSVIQNSRGSRFSWGIGYGEVNVFSTLMAYNSEYSVRSRTFLFSNPEVSCSGRPCGVENVANSALAINNVKNTIASHRDRPDNTPPFSTPAPVPVNTPAPIATPRPVATPAPVATPRPVVTPAPTRGSARTGVVTFNQANENAWSRVNFSSSFSSTPVVVMGPSSFEGVQPGSIRIRNVSNSGFEYQFDEWEYLDGSHTDETVAWIASTAGEQNWGGLNIYAGKTSNVNQNWKSVSFGDNINSTPVIIAQKEVNSGGDASALRMRNSSANGVQFKVQEEEANDGSTSGETVHYIAIMPGRGNVGSVSIAAGLTGNAIDHEFSSVSFGASHSNASIFANIQTYNGSDTASLRYNDLGNFSVDFKVEEEESRDAETDHVNENVGWFVIGR